MVAIKHKRNQYLTYILSERRILKIGISFAVIAHMMPLRWLLPPDNLDPISPPPSSNHEERIASLFITGGIGIQAYHPKTNTSLLTIEPGSRLGVSSHNHYQRDFFMDCLLGFQSSPDFQVKTFFDEEDADLSATEPLLKSQCSIIGRSPLLFGEKIQDAILHQTTDLKKEELYFVIEKLYSSSLKNKTTPQNPFLDKNQKPIPLQTLSHKEHIEIAIINAFLRRLPLLLIDCTSPFFKRAHEEGFQFPKALFQSGKTLLFMVPKNLSLLDFEALHDFRFTSALEL